VRADITSLRRRLSKGEICYIQSDVTILSDVVAAIRRVQADYGEIGAIFHTAAVVKDSLISNMSTAEFDAVLRPKVLGAWNLHVGSIQLELPIRIFALLSSIRWVNNPQSC
jgi:NAD(P)-dependent dehydrogenase (short-subunit alcohol dehydrogenase family)